MRDLLRKLLAEYGTTVERKHNSIADGTRLVVDGRGAGDLGADGQPHANFCTVTIDVAAADLITLELRGNVPWSGSLEAWAARNAAIVTRPTARELTVRIAPATFGVLVELAQLTREIGKPATAAHVPSPLKYASLRTARSLEQLHAVLARAWRGR